MSEQETPETSVALAKVDAYTARLIAESAPLRFGVARSPEELEAVYRLRCRVVIERGWAAPEAFPEGMERDVYDDEAVQIVAWDKNVIVGTTRLVLPSAARPLPTEEVFGMKIEPCGRVVDVGRTCRAPAYRDTRHRVLWGLLSQTWVEMRARGFTEICGIFTSSVVRLYRSLGLEVEILGAVRQHWGEDRHPVLVRPVESVDSFRLHRNVEISPIYSNRFQNPFRKISEASNDFHSSFRLSSPAK